MIEEVFEEAFKRKIDDGDELQTPTPKSHQVTTTIKEIPVFDLTGEDEDDMGRDEAIRDQKRRADADV